MGRVLYEPDNPDKVRHIVDGRLKQGVQYRVYVTQVNKNGMESNRSVPSYITVGDNIPPPAPELAIDTSVYANGCHAEGANCNVYLRWYIKPTPDLSRFEVFRWNSKPSWYKKDGEYPSDLAYTAETEILVGSAEYSTLISGHFSNREIYVGIRAVDLSRNYSPLKVIKVSVIDTSEVGKPTPLIHAEPYGVWAIKVWMDCPKGLDNIKAVEIYRDGQTRIAAFLFNEGSRIQCVDPSDYDIGIQHYYTYRLITEDGRVSPMSIPSNKATAHVIDTSYMDKAELEAFNDAWSNRGFEALDEAKSQVAAIVKENTELVKKLAVVTENYSEVIDQYQRLVNDFRQLSVRLENNKNTLSSFRTSINQTSNQVNLKATKQDLDSSTKRLLSLAESSLSVSSGINSRVSKLETAENVANGLAGKIAEVERSLVSQIDQNGKEITLRVSKREIDTATEQVRKDIVAQLQATADGITSVVNRDNQIKSSITQLNNSIKLCVNSNNLKSEIMTSIQNGISTAVIRADRVVVNGECLLQGNARCVGKWASNTFSIIDPRTGRPIWGSDTGTVKPQVITFNHGYGTGNWRMQWIGGKPDWTNADWVQFTPNPPVKFNGVTTVKVSISGLLHMEGQGSFSETPTCGIYVVDGTVSGDQNNMGGFAHVVNSPIAVVYSRGVGKPVGSGHNVSYTGGNGWTKDYYSRSRPTQRTNFGITWEKGLYIGRKTTLNILIKVLNRDSFKPTNVGLQNVTWRIECS